MENHTHSETVGTTTLTVGWWGQTHSQWDGGDNKTHSGTVGTTTLKVGTLGQPHSKLDRWDNRSDPGDTQSGAVGITTLTGEHWGQTLSVGRWENHNHSAWDDGDNP